MGEIPQQLTFFYINKNVNRKSLKSVEERTDFIENVSDHYLVTLSYVLDFTKSEPKDDQSSSSLRINWKKVDKDDYVKNITRKLDKSETKMNLISDLNERIHEINSVLIKSAKE